MIFFWFCFSLFFFFNGNILSFNHQKKVILVTGGAGYIGSHTVLELLRSEEYHVVVIDDLSNSSKKSLDRISKLTNSSIDFYKVNLLNIEETSEIFSRYQTSSNVSRIFCVIHFAGFKSVIESWAEPLRYYENNIVSTINLLKIMKKMNINRIIFSSSATVYGDSYEIPVSESFKPNPINPYARTKYFVEQIIKDTSDSNSSKLNYVILRYFNPVGNDMSGIIGEDPQGIPSNLMPFVARVAAGNYTHLNLYGNDYNTSDGTAIRDFIHVSDLALGHIAALRKMDNDESNLKIKLVLNLGTGKGSSVKEIVQTFSSVNNVAIPLKICKRRVGDIGFSVANATQAHSVLNWTAKFALKDMCKDLWKWQTLNPKGYF